MAKLPPPRAPVSYVWIFSRPAMSHTWMRPSLVVHARYPSSALSATAHTSPPSVFVGASSQASCHSFWLCVLWLLASSPAGLPSVQTFISPPKPTLAATVPRPPRAVQTWWQPSLCAAGMVCWSGKVASVVLWTRRAEEPLAERTEVGVGAREKISAEWAGVRRG